MFQLSGFESVLVTPSQHPQCEDWAGHVSGIPKNWEFCSSYWHASPPSLHLFSNLKAAVYIENQGSPCLGSLPWPYRQASSLKCHQ